MKAIAALLLGVASAWNMEYTLEEVHMMDTKASFKAWAEHFNRSYKTTAEEAERYGVWVENLWIIGSYNSKQLSFKLRMNQFGDMTHSEFRRYVHGDNDACFRRSDDIFNSFGQDSTTILEDPDSPKKEAPASVDWTTKGVVTPVKNQKQCGSCWAFSATGALECDYAIKNGVLNSLSEQQLVDCAGVAYGCHGCQGGQMSGALRYAAKEGGLCSETEYRYTARNGECKSTTCGRKYNPSSGYYPVTRDNSQALETAVASGCVSIGIEADQSAFQYYSSGVLTGKCGTAIDHGVLVVGYGTEGSQEYWKVKNSWGVTWGEAGYVKICRNCGKNNGKGECGILTGPNVPTFK